MARRRWIQVLVAAAVPALLVWGCDRIPRIHWVGHTDLEVEFVITDAATGGPVPGARVEVRSEGGVYAENFNQEFALTASTGGSARKECPQAMCFGTQSGLRFTDTFVVHLPYWQYRVVAEGLEASEWTYLDAMERQRQVRRVGPGKSKLVVPVSLHKRLAEPHSAPTPAK